MKNEDVKLVSFSEDDYNDFQQAWQHDYKMEEDSVGQEIPSENYEFAFSPKTFSAINKVCVSEMPYEDKLRFIKFCLGCEGINNASIISNLVILAQGRLIEEELYENEDVFFNDDIEYLDVCTDLREEIKAFNTKLVEYFLGALKSMSSLIPDGATHVPNLYFDALASYNLTTMSSAMQKVSVNYDELPFVINADVIVNRVCSKNSFVEGFMDELLSKITSD